jgi:putative chitinase
MKLEVLKGHIPDGVLSQIPSVMDKFSINTPLRLAHFLAQTAHESGKFTIVRESLNYSAERLMVVFKKYFKTLEIATQYARKPEKIGNLVYGNRMGNGDEVSGDGYKYSGKGYIQLTGKDNYSKFDKVVDDNILSNPNLVATKYPLLSAAWYWDNRHLNSFADKGATDKEVIDISHIVNGGDIGIEERKKYFHEFYTLLNA